MNLGYMPVAPPAADHVETHAEFLARLARKYGIGPPEASPPATSLADEMRAMGWM